MARVGGDHSWLLEGDGALEHPLPQLAQLLRPHKLVAEACQQRSGHSGDVMSTPHTHRRPPGPRHPRTGSSPPRPLPRPPGPIRAEYCGHVTRSPPITWAGMTAMSPKLTRSVPESPGWAG